MDDTEPRPPLTDERLAEIEQWAALTPEWTGGPDWAFHAQRDRTALLAEVRAARAREAVLQQRIDTALSECRRREPQTTWQRLAHLASRSTVVIPTVVVRAALSGDAS